MVDIKISSKTGVSIKVDKAPLPEVINLFANTVDAFTSIICEGTPGTTPEAMAKIILQEAFDAAFRQRDEALAARGKGKNGLPS